MMRNLRALILIPAVLAAVPAAAQTSFPEAEQYSFRLQARGWAPTLSSELKFSGRSEGTLVDATRDLGIKDQSTFEGKLTVQMGLGSKIRLGYTNLRYAGDRTITREIRFGNTTYARGTQLRSSIKGSYFSGDYEKDFLKGATGYVGGVIGAKFFDVDAVLSAPAKGERDVETVRLPVPVVGVVGQGYYGRFSLGGELTGFTIGPTATFLELYTHGRFALGTQVGIEAGYRVFHLHGEVSDDLLDMTIGGLFFGVEVNF
jgi:hypothetical protein